MKPRRPLSPEERRNLRRATSTASERFNIGGVEKRRGGPKPVTLPDPKHRYVPRKPT